MVGKTRRGKGRGGGGEGEASLEGVEGRASVGVEGKGVEVGVGEEHQPG